MAIKDIIAKTQRFDAAARRERLQGPDIIQKTKAVRHPAVPVFSEVHLAYCKNDAGSGSTIICCLDTYPTGREVTVHFSITLSGSHMNLVVPLLSTQDKIAVKYDTNSAEWWCTDIFHPYEECDCYMG